MNKNSDYVKDIAEIRSMMERSSKFLSLSGWAGIMAGIYAIAGAFIAFEYLNFNPGYSIGESTDLDSFSSVSELLILGFIILALALSTAIFLSSKKIRKKGDKLWNPISRRLVINMAVPLVTGGLLILIMISKGLVGFILPFSLLFYGLSLVNASNFTYSEVKSLGLIQIALGVLGSLFIDWGLWLWTIGFGFVHIIYGIYMHYKYEK